MNIVAEGVSVVIDGQAIFNEASLTCAPGTMTAIVGPSGSGKTTLLHCLGLLQVPTRGTVFVDSIDTAKWTGSRRRRFWRDQAAFVLQDHGIIDEESVAFNVTLRSRIAGRRVLGDHDRLAEALAHTGLTERANEPASHLSGGEKQRLAIARAIYKRASAIFVDEPTASLDDDNRRMVIDLLRGQAARGCTVAISTHDDRLVAACGERYSVARHEKLMVPRD